MKAFELARAAVGDLQDIWEYISEDSFDVADRVIADFVNAFAKLVESPGMGPHRPDLTNRDVHFWPVHSYLVVYTTSDPLRIVRVVHTKRDLKKLLEHP